MGPGEELSRLCDRLDHLLLNLMEDLENLQDKRESLNRLIEQGWFSLSQARYTMGTKSVSSLQYSPDMAPSTLVQDR
ncbi:hypothetical protein GDO86_018732 [Hymenochirus boettgeri]|uniref:Vacuolar ATPase assembly protein VMA22 n=1 Tax=Hymenochirus boettgeri TaxID=247094 RepID=A0A8T2ICK5_9PIPI|nr:hypothetical protein GDO86_018732 [Hymenochirus boettgeri]